jgi:AraC family transcriptional regulator, transcriptional activator of pobA
MARQPEGDIQVRNKLQPELQFKVSRFKEVIVRTRPHKHEGYYELIYLSEGAGFHWIDTVVHQINAPVVYFLSGQLHYWEMTAVPRGYVAMFREEFAQFQNPLLRLIQSLEGTTEIGVSAEDGLDALFDDMEAEYRNQPEPSLALIGGYLQVMLARLSRKREHHESSAPASAHHSTYRRFLQILRQAHPAGNLKVQDLAGQLNLTPQNLNAIVRKLAGKSAGELIREQVMLEAKRYLLHTDRTVSEIAFSLDFTDPSHFVKFFKKYAGETPQAFRSRHFQ